jgi:hypothetical protein
MQPGRIWPRAQSPHAFLSAQVGALVGGLLCMGAVQLRVLQVHSSNSTNATAQ